MKRYLVTAALPYVNGPLHIGHLSGAYLTADIFVRYLRSNGKDVVFVCGSDEHGAAIMMRAKKEGLTPQEIVDKYHPLVKKTFEDLGVSFDIYHRTSDPLHHQTAQAFFLDLHQKGEFIQETTEQYYDEEQEQFLADRYIQGTCPKCANESAYGDQCERCGSTLSPTELINPKSTLSGKTPVLRPTTHWFFSLDKHTDWLREWINEGTINGLPHHDAKAWKTQVVAACNSWLGLAGDDLRPRSITRDLDWGVKVPLPDAEGKVLYVWFDAPIGYVSATIAWAAENGKNWEDYWKSKDTELVHFIGKDNIVFHCIIFPAMLKAHGDFVLPQNVPANQFMNLEGEKLSTSRNWAVWAHEYLEDFNNLPNAADALRYILIKYMPEQKDSEFTWANFKETIDADLVGKYANFINRVTVLIHKYYDGKVPDLSNAPLNYNPLSEVPAILAEIGSNIERYEFREAQRGVISIAELGNRFLQDHEPWKAIKSNKNLVDSVLYIGIQLVEILAVGMQPFMPASSAAIRKILNLPPIQNGDWTKMCDKLEKEEALISAGHQIGEVVHLFTRPDEAQIQAQINKLEATKVKKVTYEPLKSEITYDDFSKLDIRSGTIVAAEKVKKANKLLRLTVDLGFEQRTIVSGIAEHFTPEQIIGQQVLVLANLAPRDLKGITSQGMILMAENHLGELAFVHPKEGFGNGLTVR